MTFNGYLNTSKLPGFLILSPEGGLVSREALCKSFAERQERLREAEVELFGQTEVPELITDDYATEIMDGIRDPPPPPPPAVKAYARRAQIIEDQGEKADYMRDPATGELLVNLATGKRSGIRGTGGVGRV